MRPLRIDTDGVDCTVGANAAGHVANGRNGILLFEIDGFGALSARHREPRRDTVHRDHAAGAQHLAARDCELAHRTASEYRDYIAALDLGQMRTEISRGENIRYQ